MPPFNTIVVVDVNTFVVGCEGVIAHMHTLNSLADRLVFARKARGMTQEDLAKASGITQQTIGNYEGARGAEGIDHRRKAPLVDIAAALAVPLPWLRDGKGKWSPDDQTTDLAQVNTTDSVTNIDQSGLALEHGRRTVDKIPFHNAPITRWPTRGEKLNSSLRMVGRMSAIPGRYSELAQVVQVVDNPMSPEIEQGEFIAIDPRVEPRNGDVVIVQDKVGEFHLRRFRRVIADEFEAWAANPHYSTLSSRVHGLSVAAVMVCHMRVRQP